MADDTKYLMDAVVGDWESMLESLTLNPDVKNSMDRDGRTAIFLALQAGRTNVVEEILKGGFEQDSYNSSDNFEDMVRTAVQFGNLTIIEEAFRLEGGIFKDRAEGPWTKQYMVRQVFVNAAIFGQLDVMKWLLATKERRNMIGSHTRYFAMISALDGDHHELTKWLVDNKHVDVDKKINKRGDTMLLLAAKEADEDDTTLACIRKLLEIAQATIDVKDKYGKTVWDKLNWMKLLKNETSEVEVYKLLETMLPHMHPTEEARNKLLRFGNDAVKDLVVRGMRLKTNIGAYQEKRHRAFEETLARVPNNLRNIISGYFHPLTTEEMWNTGLGD
jgi:ankyrin repeat protein